ncbi:MAG: peptidoglycan editing factor PgeF [Gammaproteobacteria bacterium]|nr:peptidoglycan editing factor PgeF [Gammaproteobacteria bacterium]
MDLIVPDWPAPSNVHACVTTRVGGDSDCPYDTLNLGDHVGDSPACVAQNRQVLQQRLALPSTPIWLQQVHGRVVVELPCSDTSPVADAVYTRQAGQVCAVLTADCLPLLLCDQQGRQVVAVHAGWRGLANGVIEQTLKTMGADAGQLMAWLGPAIGPEHFQVGDDVYSTFVAHSVMAKRGFVKDGERWLMDIYELARQRLQSCGVSAIYGGGLCTYADKERFYSYRRDGVTGRMASLVWLTSP